MKKTFNRFAKDSLWTMAGIILLNGIAQIVVYPYLRQYYGQEYYGKILTMIGIINILSVSVGASFGNSRLVAKSRNIKISNNVYMRYMLLFGVAAIAVGAVVCLLLEEPVFKADFVFYVFLMIFTTWRYYAEVEFRLNTNYVGLFVFYLLISCGYLAGMAANKLLSQWSANLLLGEMFGVVFVIITGMIFKPEKTDNRSEMKGVWNSAKHLVFSQLLINVIFNSDRLVLMAACSGSAVTIFYLASAVGKMISLLTSSFNSVFIGYLSDSEKTMSVQLFKRIFYITTAVSAILSVACLFGSVIYVKILYPADYAQAKPFFYLANFAQILYFTSGIFTTILLRYENETMQSKINLIYTVVFCILTIIPTFIFGIWGYTVGLFISNVSRYAIAAHYCYRTLRKRDVANEEIH